MATQRIKSCPALEHLYSINLNRNQPDYAPHRHPFWELILFERGEGIHTINGNDYPFCPGNICLLSPTDIHCITNAPGTTRDCIKIKFSYNIWQDSLKNTCHFDCFPVVTTLCDADHEKAIRLLEFLNDEHNKQRQTDNSAFSLNLIAGLLLLIHRNLSHPVSTDIGKTRRILLYIQEHFCEPITITDVANALNYSPKYFSRLFVKTLGIPFHEYIKDLRLNYAYHLIKYSDLPITDICYNTGFTSPSLFSKTFKQKYGLSPNSLRNPPTLPER